MSDDAEWSADAFTETPVQRRARLLIEKWLLTPLESVPLSVAMKTGVLLHQVVDVECRGPMDGRSGLLWAMGLRGLGFVDCKVTLTGDGSWCSAAGRSGLIGQTVRRPAELHAWS